VEFFLFRLTKIYA